MGFDIIYLYIYYLSSFPDIKTHFSFVKPAEDTTSASYCTSGNQAL